VSWPALGPTQPPVQWVPGVLSPGLKRGWVVTLTTHSHLVPRSKTSRSCTSSPSSASMACRTLLYVVSDCPWFLLLHTFQLNETSIRVRAPKSVMRPTGPRAWSYGVVRPYRSVPWRTYSICRYASHCQRSWCASPRGQAVLPSVDCTASLSNANCWCYLHGKFRGNIRSAFRNDPVVISAIHSPEARLRKLG